MAMNAAARSLVGLITGANVRFVIPVYQRPYSWGEEQCLQLWDDVLSVGRRPEDRHFTGSVVWVQDGTMSASGVTPLLLIDGQQRITTLTLLIAALADYSRSHPEKQLRFSHREILGRGYLIDEYKPNDDRYKLTLSQGDKATLKSLLENLADPDAKVVEESPRIIENFELFKKRIAALEDPNIVWDGIQRLDIVSISLDAGKDNPQLIFESMNSTGKDLSSADLIRNYVLMGLPREEQDKLYLNHWRAIEETLGADSYDEVFDGFVRDYLTVLYAPESLAQRDVYPIFKRHVVDNGYDKDGRIIDLLKQMEDFARYYSCITSGAEPDAKLKAALDSVARLDITVTYPLLMSFYEDCEAEAFAKEDFVSMVWTLESYLFRRAVCDAATNSLQKFFASVIAKLNRIQEDGGNYREAFEAYLLLEAGTARRFPTDQAFAQALRTRDSYHFRRSFYMLSNLENMNHPKDPVDIDGDTYTIEHVMPQNAMAHEEWRNAMEGREDDFESLVNCLGNLTLTAYNSELSDGTFEEKKKRIVGGYDKEHLVISRSIQEADEWVPSSIEKRAAYLAERAVARWPMPSLEDACLSKYDPKPEKKPQQRARTAFKTVFEAGLIGAGTKLVPVSDNWGDASAEVTGDGKIALWNGEEFASPSLAAIKAVSLKGGSSGSRNGWRFWRIAPDGPVLDELRKKFYETNVGVDRIQTRSLFWNGFYEYCADIPGFTDSFGNVAERLENPDSWTSFGIGKANCHLEALLGLRDGYVGVEIWFRNKEAYRPIFDARADIEQSFGAHSDDVVWDSLDEDKKTRTVIAKHYVDFRNDDWQEMYASIVSWLWKLKAAVDEHIR